jgi:hypothetical protein
VPRGEHKAPPRPFRVKEIDALVQDGYDLCVTGSSLQAAVTEDEGFWDKVKHVKIWARMSPEDKEAVLRALKEQGFHTLMCGDGANDVGALKQASLQNPTPTATNPKSSTFVLVGLHACVCMCGVCVCACARAIRGYSVM